MQRGAQKSGQGPLPSHESLAEGNAVHDHRENNGGLLSDDYGPERRTAITRVGTEVAFKSGESC